MPLSRGQRLRRLRDEAGVEQQEAAAAIGVSQPYLSMLERDQKGRNVDHLRGTFERAAEYYGVLPHYLLAELPQEYARAWTEHVQAPATAGQRLTLLMEELQRRWGDEFSVPEMAASLGSTEDAVRQYLADQVPMTETVAAQLSAITGAPVDWLVPRPSTTNTTPAIQRVVELAVESGLQPSDLEAMIRVWLTAKSTKPSGQ